MRAQSIVSAAFVATVLAACAGVDANGNPYANAEEATGSSKEALAISSGASISTGTTLTTIGAGNTVSGTPTAIPPFAPFVTSTCLGAAMSESTITLQSGVPNRLIYACYPFACSSSTGTCSSSCTSDANCSGGASCVSGQCVNTNVYHCEQSSDHSWSEVNGAGIAHSCGFYSCNPVDGRCLTTCESNKTADCAYQDSQLGTAPTPICDVTQNPARCVVP